MAPTVDGAALRDLLQLLSAAPPRQASAEAVCVDAPVLAALQRVIPSDCVSYNDYFPRRLITSAYLDTTDVGGVETPEEAAESDALFYSYYWASPCSHPDRSGDWETAVTLSDLCSVREWRASPMYVDLELDFDRDLLIPLPSPPGHSRRVRFERGRGRDFDDIDRAVAALVRPHLVAYVHALDLVSRGIAPLTLRQRQLMGLVVAGQSNDQIARTLGISAATVRTHLQQIYPRLGVNSRGEAAALLRSAEGGVTAVRAAVGSRG